MHIGQIMVTTQLELSIIINYPTTLKYRCDLDYAWSGSQLNGDVTKMNLQPRTQRPCNNLGLFITEPSMRYLSFCPASYCCNISYALQVSNSPEKPVSKCINYQTEVHTCRLLYTDLRQVQSFHIDE